MRGYLVRTTAAIVAAALLLLTVGFWLVLRERLRHETSLVLRDRIRAVSALIVVDDGRLAVEETAGDEAVETGFWLFDLTGRAVAAPPTSSAVDSAAVDLGRQGQGRRDAAGSGLLAAPARIGDRRVGTIVVGVPLSTFENTQRLAVVAALAIDAVVLAGTVPLTRRNVRKTLAPVAAMTATAQAWSEQDLDRRFGLGPPRDELTALAATLDSLLGRITAVLRREQRLTAEIAHELRTPLARMRSSAEIAVRHGTDADRVEALTEVTEETARLAGIIATLLAVHTQGAVAAGTCDAAGVVAGELAALAAREPPIGVVAVPQATDRTPAGCDADHLRRILSPVLSNAVRHARSRLTVTTAGTGRTVLVTVDDDGPGFAPAEVEHVFEPGFRGRDADGAGSGLGLPLARRLARAAGGEVTVSAGPGGHVHITLPAA